MAPQPIPLLALVETKRDEIVALLRDHCATSIAVFGSVARGEATASSDIDFLVEFEPGSSLFDLIHLEEDLEALLGARIDVVSTGGLLHRDDDIRRDAIRL